MIRRPPRSTLFPTRRSSDLRESGVEDGVEWRTGSGVIASRCAPTGYHRSEEHTSELQSPDHLVCRLLLEKKNSKTSWLSHRKLRTGNWTQPFWYVLSYNPPS